MSAMPQSPDRPRESDAALEAWVRRMQPPTWRFLRACGCPAQEADDLVQETLLAALHKRVFARDDTAAAAWLRGAACNLWRMHLRGDARRHAHTRQLAIERRLDVWSANDTSDGWRQALRACLEQLDGRARVLLQRHYGEAAPRDVIAAELGLGEEGVKTFLRRVRDLLRQCVQRRLHAEESEP